MAQHYTPIWDDWLKVTQELNDQEKGRLIDAIVLYARGDDWQERIKGNERYVFPGYQARIDRYKEANAVKTEKSEKTEISKKSEISKNSEISKKTELDKKNKNSEIPNVYVKDKDIKENDDNKGIARAETSFGSVSLDPLIVKVQQELNGLTDAHYFALEDYRQELGDDVVSHAIDNAVGQGVRNWAYVERVLSNYLSKGVKSIGEAKAADEEHRKAHAAAPARPKHSVNPFLDALQRGEFNDAG